ncbi:hypothetical protein JCM33374_g4095 [Metschnikowia sp. JCM 33374]|nr:hypothetical protein JCM33374_g4095 [Metschnikowia sp. JCM 33374]
MRPEVLIATTFLSSVALAIPTNPNIGESRLRLHSVKPSKTFEGVTLAPSILKNSLDVRGNADDQLRAFENKVWKTYGATSHGFDSGRFIHDERTLEKELAKIITDIKQMKSPDSDIQSRLDFVIHKFQLMKKFSLLERTGKLTPPLRSVMLNRLYIYSLFNSSGKADLIGSNYKQKITDYLHMIRFWKSSTYSEAQFADGSSMEFNKQLDLLEKAVHALVKYAPRIKQP